MPSSALIYVRLGAPHPDKQEAVCLAYAEQHRLKAVALCHHPEDCVTLVRMGIVAVVIAAVDVGPELTEQIEAVGGDLRVARPTQRRVRREVGFLVARMFRHGMSPKEIAEILEVPTVEVRRSIIRARLENDGPPGRVNDPGAG